jgi:hypothetical protein
MRRVAPALAAALLALTVGSCTIGTGGGRSGGAKLTVTRDFGAETLVRASVRRIPGGETVMRQLQRRAKVETRYGGRFVNAIGGVSSGSTHGRRHDWFYYVNGIEADSGAADWKLHGGDRVWWDYRDWGAAMRVPAVVGSFPEPFIHGTDGKRFPVRIDCAQDAAETCRRVADELDRAGISPSTTALGAPAGKEVLRFVIGRWDDVRRDGAARQLEDGPSKSGVFARVVPTAGGYELDLLDGTGGVARRLRSNTGLVAATRFEQQQPTWVVTGLDRAGLEHAAGLLQERLLRDRYAVASVGQQPVPIPLPAGEAR